MNTIYLALGTNLGDRVGNLRAALTGMATEVIVLAESRIYKTPAWGMKEQPEFLNMAVKAQTDLAPTVLLAHLKQLEVEMGRKSTIRWGPRLIDMDILFYGDLVLDAAGLTIPHPELHKRAFVLVPLVDIAADHVHPVLGKTMRELLQEVDASGIRPA